LRHRRRASILARGSIAFGLALGGCREAALPFAGSTPGGRERVDQAVSALYDRYANVQHGARYEYARHRLASAALVPSRVFNDTAVWTSMPDSTRRRLVLGESKAPGGFLDEEAAATAPWPAEVGDARHQVDLHNLGGGDYAWNTDVAIALGTIRAQDIADGIVALLTSAAGRSDTELRAGYLAAFPHTTAVLSQLFTLDTLHALPQPDGSSLVTLVFTLHPKGLEPRYPEFAAYMARYVSATVYDFHIADHAGAEYFNAAAGGPPVVVHARVRGHEFLPLAGGERPLPDSLVLSGSFSTKIRFFHVGAHHFTSDFLIARSAHVRSWTVHFGQEPDWLLPFAAARLLRSPLRRPFQGGGMWYQVAVRDSAGAQTILSRRSHAEVHESAIMRFIGGLVSRVLLDLDGNVQREEFQFFASVFDAMRTDFAAVLPPP
jgi:hypothetical protein